MPAPNSLAGYPEWFFTIAERAQADGYQEELELTSNGTCVNTRQRFYRFRQLLAESNHPHAKACMDLVLTIKGNFLMFSKQAGLTPSAMQKLGMGVAKELAPANAPDRVAVSDAAEDALNDFLGIKPASAGQERSAREVACQSGQHEADPATGAFCLHCGMPLKQ